MGLCLALLCWLVSCSIVEVLAPLDGENSGDSDSDSDTDTDTDADADTDTDTEPDPSCPEMPDDACDNISVVGGVSCESPAYIARSTVATGLGMQDTLVGAFDNDQACSGNGGDQFYKLYILAGETLTVFHTVNTPGAYVPVVAVFKTSDPCVATGCNKLVSCDENLDGDETASINGYTSTSSSWHIIKIDSLEDLTGVGDHSINVVLQCISPIDCDC